jgi:hypothetical protein
MAPSKNLILKIVGPVIGGLVFLACGIALFLGWIYLEFEYKRYTFSHRPEWMATNDTVFIAKLKEKFPPGIAEDKIIAELRIAGFELYTDPPRAYRSISAFPCKNSWSITWEKNPDRKITAVKGGHAVSCL